MRESYVPLFESMMTSSLWAQPGDIIKCWFALLMRADWEGYWCGTAPGLALEAHVPIETARKALALLEEPDPDSRDTEHEGRRVQRVPRGWFIFNLKKARERAAREAERARKRNWARENRARDYETPEASNEEAKQEPIVDSVPIAVEAPASCDPADRRAPSVDAVSTLRSEPVDARKRKEEITPAIAPAEIDAVERELLGVPPSPPPDLNKREEAEEGPRFYDLCGFEPSAGLVAWFERYGLPPMALHARLGKVRNAKVAIGGKNGVADREQWCRDQAPRWKQWWLDDGGRAEPLPVTRRARPRPPPASSPMPVAACAAMPEALLKFVATGQLPQPRAAPAAMGAA